MLLELLRTLGFRTRQDTPETTIAGQNDTWVIDARRMGLKERLIEFWQYRRIFLFFAKRFIKRMYQGMRIGIAWLFVRPLMPIFISAFVFGSLLGIPSDGVPYFLFFLAGMVSWMLFERSLLWVTRSLQMASGLIKKAYFPRLIIPAASVSPALSDFGVYMLLLLGSLIYYAINEGVWYLRSGPELLLAPVAVLMAVSLAIAVGLFTSVWQTRVREVRFTIRYVSRFWFFLTPVIYPISEVPPDKRWLIFLNPMASIVETFKWATLGIGAFYPVPLLFSFLIIVVVMAGGIWYFGYSEATNVDKL
jgi:lipopolysaccharide transport system permease protein